MKMIWLVAIVNRSGMEILSAWETKILAEVAWEKLEFRGAAEIVPLEVLGEKS